ncbi:hypothetical protein OEZ85_001825 [Tetradesmus obliquus]|uniref:Uncharacterized protein n=1 Tax=Tetradesmus obliquus TaxID=3088 RepID=A0ABY8U170_TETOB|nr:hypothetical protein OEZ85_001825 [Tetradesmus obliquus]
MDVAAADAFAKKKLRQVPRLNKKVQDARVIHDYKGKGSKIDAELAAAQARLAQLQTAIAPASRLTAEPCASDSPSSALQQTTSSSQGRPADVTHDSNHAAAGAARRAAAAAAAGGVAPAAAAAAAG